MVKAEVTNTKPPHLLPIPSISVIKSGFIIILLFQLTLIEVTNQCQLHDETIVS